MSDEALRSALQAWRNNPGDRDALERAIAAHRRVGLPVPDFLTSAPTYSQRVFQAPWAFRACAVLPAIEPHDESLKCLTTWRRLESWEKTKAIEVPPCLFWWVRPQALGRKIPEVLEFLEREKVPGLSCAESRVTNEHLAVLADNTTLEALNISSCPALRPEVLSTLPPSLRYLDTAWCTRLTNEGWEGLARCPSLTHLRTSRHVHGYSLPTIFKAAPQLTTLTLLGVGLKASDLMCLEDLRELEELDLSGTGFSRSVVPALAKMPHLRRLSLSECGRLTSKAVVELAETCPGLTHLDLSENGLKGSAGYQALAGHPALSYLAVGEYGFSDWASLECLRSSSTLKTLDVSCCPLPPAGFVEGFPPGITVKVVA